MNNKLKTFICGIGLLLSIAAILYPVLANYIYDQLQDTTITDFDMVVVNKDESELEAEYQRCVEYNNSLVQTTQALADNGEGWESLEMDAAAYWERLNMTNNGSMGYLEIPIIDSRTTIYHGTSDEVLQYSIGHMIESSLPIGGDSTHAVVTGHTGVSNRKLFTDLAKVKVGDYFFVHVLNKILAYQVDQILTVLPYEIDELKIQPGHDYMTLITCTPYGINSHRLLVRGERVPLPADYDAAKSIVDSMIKKQQEEKPMFSSIWLEHYAKAILMGLGGGIIGLVVLLLIRRAVDKNNPTPEPEPAYASVPSAKAKRKVRRPVPAREVRRQEAPRRLAYVEAKKESKSDKELNTEAFDDDDEQRPRIKHRYEE